MIIRSNRELKAQYDQLGPGDCFVGILGFKHLKPGILLDLTERGVRVLPSAVSQILSGSKVYQAYVFRQWMIPHTLVINRRADLMAAVNTYAQQGIGAVVTKEDHLHCGFGIHRWDGIEAVYNQASFHPAQYPFVVQPFLTDYVDVRVIIAGDYHEAYTRENPYNFRMNLAAGGIGKPFAINHTQLALCRTVMERGKFPYAHLDLLVVPDGRTYLSEISLNGGLKGARISRVDLDALKADLLDRAARA
ncbi:MAG: hypothetical protein JRI36_03395 [Deltaproteobacteria bacterium]|nr:hypothetical protein [Deltaproteobacteria bacterium]